MNDFENQNLNGQPAVQPTEPAAPAPEAAQPTPAPAPTYQQAPYQQQPYQQQPYQQQPYQQQPYQQQPYQQQPYQQTYQQPYQAPVTEAPKKKKGGKAVLIILLILLLAGIAVGGFFLIKSMLDAPGNSNRILQAYENTAKAILPSGMQNIGKECSVDISADVSKLPIELPLSGSINGKINFKNRKLGAELKASVMGINVNALSLFGSADDLVLQSPILLGDDYYGISLKDAEANLGQSILNPDSTSEFALDKEAYEVFLKFIPAFRAFASIDVSKFDSSFKNAVWKEIDALNVTERSTDKITVLEAEYDVNVIAIRMNGTQFAEFMKKMLDWAKEDAEAAKIMDLIDVILAAKDTSLSDLREQLENPTEDLNKLTLQLTGYIDTKTGYLVRTEAEVKTDDTPEENQIFLDSLSYKSDIRLEEKTVRMNGEIKMHYAGSDLDVNAIRQLKSSMIWDKTKEEMTISAGGDDAESELVLEIKEASDSLTITPKKINVSDDEESALSKFDPSFITVRISAKADEPAVPTYKDILKMSTDELTDLLNGLLKKLQSLGLGNVLY